MSPQHIYIFISSNVSSVQASKGLQLLAKDHEEVKDSTESLVAGEKHPLLTKLKKLNISLSDVEVKLIVGI